MELKEEEWSEIETVEDIQRQYGGMV